MKLSWTSLKISIAGAKLSHLVQKDRIWDPGSMVEQARIIFLLVQKAQNSESIDILKKSCSIICFEQLKIEVNESKRNLLVDPIINEISIVEVHPGKNNRPDMFAAILKGTTADVVADNTKEFSAQCSFVRQGDWWLLDDMRTKVFFKN